MTTWLGFANKLNPGDEEEVEDAEVAFDALDDGPNQEVSSLIL